MRRIGNCLLFAVVAIIVSCSRAEDGVVPARLVLEAENSKTSPVRLPLDESMAIFNKESNQQFGLPTVLVFDRDRNCVAKASNRDIYGDSFREQIENRSLVCPELVFAEIENRTGVQMEPNDDLIFVVLIESGKYCTTCAAIVGEFEDQVLQPLSASHSVYWIDIGMTEWFSSKGM